MNRLLIHTHMRNALQRTPPFSTFHTAAQDTIDHFKLATKQLRRLRWILRRLEQSNRPGLKGLRIVLRSTRLGNLDRVHPRGRLDLRYTAVDKTSKMKPIQVPPRTLLAVVIQRPSLSRLWADQRTARIGNVNVNPLSLRIQKHPIILPITP